MEIIGIIKGGTDGSIVVLDIQAESMKGQLKALTYALIYPIIFAMFLTAVILYPTMIAVYVFGAFAFFLPIVFHQVYVTFYYHEPNPEWLIGRLAKDLNGVIENIVIG